jgi:hypothetical protein
MDRATNLKEQVDATSRPSHLLIFVHPTIHQEIGRSFGDRGSNSQSGTVPLSVIDQPVALAGQITIRRVQGGERWRLSRVHIGQRQADPPLMKSQGFDRLTITMVLSRPERSEEAIFLVRRHSHLFCQISRHETGPQTR